jgi:hypothetical protein
MAKLQLFAILNQAAHRLATPSRVTLSEIRYKQQSPPNREPQKIPASRVIRIAQALCFAA